jgi:hypothetical protein
MKKGLIFLVLCMVSLATAQTNWEKKLSQYSFAPPLKGAMYLSGNFCELRSNHFHGGLDIKTGGVEGKSVYSIADGYVSRIKISPYGYGRALYIHHPKSGVTSVYAHLKEFSPEIKKFIQRKQKERKRNSIDFSFDKPTLHVKKGEKIALSGNSGGSYAPHLHFEVRKLSNQHPINPQYIFKNIKDQIPPEILSLMVYDTDPQHKGLIIGRKKEKVIHLGGGKYCIDSVLDISPNTDFGVKVYDLASGAKNKNGFYKLDYIIDGKRVMNIEMDEYSYSETRYINSLVDYEFFKERKERFVKLFPLPNAKISVVKWEDYNMSQYRDGKTHQAKIIARDVKGNLSVLEWDFRISKSSKKMRRNNGLLVEQKSAKTITSKKASLSFTPKALYTDSYFRIDTASEKNKGIVYTVEPEYRALHQRINLKLPIPKEYHLRDEKLCIVQRNKKGGKSYHKAKVDGFYANIGVRSLGDFYFAIDDDDPYLKFLNCKEGQNMSKQNQIKIKTLDLHSGIDSYNATLDGKWVILYYDAKNKKITHTFESKPSGKKHTFVLTVKDECGNKKIIKRQFVR